MKKLVTLFVFVLLNSLVFAQAFWNKKLPISIPKIPIGDSRTHDGNILLFSAGQLFELDWQGTITGRGGNIISPSPILLSNFIQKRSDPQGKPFFLAGWRSYPSPPKYNFSYYIPDKGGWQSFLSFGDGEFGNIGSRGPAIMELTDTTLMVFTKSYVRKIACPRDTCWIEWVKPIALTTLSFPNAAATNNDEAVFVTTKGEISAVSSGGFQLWLKAYDSYVFRGIARVGDGFVVCGADTSEQATLVKLAFNGDLVWGKTFPEDVEFNALTINPDGSIVVTGKSAIGDISLLKTNPNGGLLWRKTFQKGHGSTLIPMPDAGYFLTGGGQTGFFAIKTNAEGETPSIDDRFLFRNRNLNNGGFSLTQLSSSTLFFNGTTSEFLIPADSTTSSIFAHSPWLAGIDQSENLHVSASIFGDYSGSDFRGGIISSPKEDFDRVWKITRAEIAQVRRDLKGNGVLDSPLPFDLLTWPARGNPHFKQNLNFTSVMANPDSLPAPFIDVNGDGLYNVFDGDYPQMKGDQMLWFAFNDDVEHGLSGSLPLRADFFVTLYAYDCPQNESVSSSLFAEYTMVNRSAQAYSDMYFGFFTDFDIGCTEDDNVGTIPEVNSFYAYNSDAVDGSPGSSCSGGSSTYGENPPIEAITMLNHSFNHGMFHNRGYLPNPIPPLTIHNLLRSIWPDGTPQTVGGDGYNPGNTDFTDYVLYGNPSDPQGWSQCANTALADRRMTSSHGPFTFATGDTFSMQLVFTFHPDIPHPCPDVAGLVKPSILQIQQWHDDGTLNAPLDLGSVQILQPGQSLTLDASIPNAMAYAWSTGANTPSIVVNQVGEYTVSVTRASGCEVVETVLVKSASGTSSPTLPAWKLQPNPAHDVLKIVFENTEKPVSALLYNAQGQMVATKNSVGSNLEISVLDLPAGLYWAEFWRESRFLGSRKVVVAR